MVQVYSPPPPPPHPAPPPPPPEPKQEVIPELVRVRERAGPRERAATPPLQYVDKTLWTEVFQLASKPFC
jgi:hypothetical protein